VVRFGGLEGGKGKMGKGGFYSSSSSSAYHHAYLTGWEPLRSLPAARDFLGILRRRRII
jgi:hypothetical protein